MRNERKCNNYIHIKGRLQKKLEDCKISQTETKKNFTMLMKNDQIRVLTREELIPERLDFYNYSETSDLNQNFYNKSEPVIS